MNEGRENKTMDKLIFDNEITINLEYLINETYDNENLDLDENIKFLENDELTY